MNPLEGKENRKEREREKDCLHLIHDVVEFSPGHLGKFVGV